MSRVLVALASVLVGMAALTACSSSSDKPDSASGGAKPASSPAPKPITKDLAQADLTQALLGDGEMLPGYSLHGDKSTTEGQYCNATDDDSTPKGWVRGSDVAYEYNGSTLNMAFVHICLFDSAKDAHSAYAAWKGNETSKQQDPKHPVGDESTLVINPGASEDSVYGYSRSGKVNIRVKIDGATGGDPSGAEAMLSAALKRLQQLQGGKPATVTAADEQANARK
ncbi:hypothetical protein [Streptomyces benahoarensis]|uniref:Lipoprotein n=1 Tax=Streptomyces benahoarensis TaxID=2595054 RepID=A0A553ZLM3_9ACTN|nr:hypothetical protein [Streptomyces benahoarensis]TSB23333.1 hypothetical protein FNJ62_15295 [Streptomyces benahoarensis]TSB42347.1 hypothetical protein FNZ23_10345 [Streptomyces benahoarensis]